MKLNGKILRQALAGRSAQRLFVAIALPGIILVAIDAPAAFAADYAAGASVEIDARHNDNIRMVKQDKTELSGAVTSPTLALNANTENTQAGLNTRLDFGRYDNSAYNSDDYNIALALAHQFTSSSVGLNASAIDQSTVTSELLASGRIGDKAERSQTYQLSPFWNYSLNETNLLSLDGSYTLQDYQSASYVGYDNWNIDAGWTHVLNERWKLNAVATYSQFTSDYLSINVPAQNTLLNFSGILIPIPAGAIGQQSYASKSKSAGGQLGFTYLFSESTSLHALLGRSQNTIEYLVKDPLNICDSAFQRGFAPLCNIDSQSGPISTAVIDGTWANERQQLQFSAEKSQQPTSNGYAVDGTRATVSWSYRLSELDQLSTAITALRNRALGSAAGPNTLADRDYATVSLRFQHGISEDWSVSAAFDYSYQKYANIDYSANGRAIALGIRYQPQQWHWSR